MPMLAVCIKCFREYPDDGPSRCPECRARDRAARAVNPRRAGYSSRTYRTLRPKVIREQHNRCAHCRQTAHPDHPDKKLRRLTVNHRDGNTNNNVRANLEALCGYCHPLEDARRRRETR